MIIVGVFGFIGAGKDTIADYLVERYGFKKLVMSDIITDELRHMKIPVNRKEMQDLSARYKEKYGKGVWARKSVEHIKKAGWDKVVISGMRDTAEITEFKKTDRFVLLFVHADQETRFKRLAARASVKDAPSRQQLIAQEKRELELFDLFRNPDEFADYVVENNSSIEDLKSEVDTFVQKSGLSK